MHFDLPLEQLQTYLPARSEPTDFDAFWTETLEQTRAYPLEATFVPVQTALRTLDVCDVTFAGYGGQPIKGWLLLPKNHSEPLPCIVEYIGYGGGRGLPLEWTLFPSAGYALLVMDTRGQGSTWRTGDTPDSEPQGGNPQVPGFMTRGILQPHTYYYRRLFTDAVRAVEVAQSHPAVRSSQVFVNGGSQGGGIALAVAGLVHDLAGVISDVPFLCHFPRATTLVDTLPYGEISAFCRRHRDKVDAVFQTLSYFDGLNFAARAKNPALFSVGLMDDICPPSTVFAAFNHYAGTKEIRVYPFNNHEGGEAFHILEKLRWLEQQSLARA